MRLSVTLTTLALLSSPAAFSQAQPQSPPASPNAMQRPAPPTTGAEAPAPAADIGAIFDKLNTSHTGKLTREEAQAHPTVAENFDKADTNKDGVLTKDEFLTAFRSQ